MFKLLQKFSSVFILALALGLPTLAGGVSSYTGSVSSATAGVSSGAGSSATAVINMDLKVPTFMGLGVYSTAGANSTLLFSNPTSNFPGGTTFTSAESVGVLLSSEGNLNSKFDIDGVTSTTDAVLISNAISASSATTSQDIIIKGATYTTAAAATNLTLTTSVNSLTLTGGTGTAPTYVFRAIGGIPGGGVAAINTQAAPATTGLSLTSARRTAAGYSRFAIVGDLTETSVRNNTLGNWTGTLTITLTGI